MKKGWKLLPKEYQFSYSLIIWGLGFQLFIVSFLYKSINKNTRFYVGNKAVSFSEFLMSAAPILLIGLFIASLGIIKNIKVYRLRKELKLLKENFQCYEGTVSSIERFRVNDVMKSQANNRHNKYTYIVNRAVVEYIDEDGRKRIANSEEYDEELSVFLKDNRAKVYVSKNGNNRIVDDLSWRQSNKDGYIDIPAESMNKIIRIIYYNLARWRVRIQVGTLLIVFIAILVIIYQ